MFRPHFLLHVLLVLQLFSLEGNTPCSLEEKVGQLMMVSFQGEKGEGEVQKIVEECFIGGVIYYNFANGRLDRDSVFALSRKIQSYKGIPRWIAVDQEGGRVQRCAIGFTRIPPASNWSVLSHEALFHLGLNVAMELKEVGIGMNFSPVIDLENNRCKALFQRTISQDPVEISRVATALLRGFEKGGILGVIKHFPGHGAVDLDSHYEMPVIDKPFERLVEEDLAPFFSMSKKADALMTAHILVPDFDSEKIVSLSKKWHAYIRDKMKFKGLIVTDSLTMQAVIKSGLSIERAALEALKAGSDILLFGGQNLLGFKLTTLGLNKIRSIHRYLCQEALKDPELKDKIEEAFERNLFYKRKWGVGHPF